MPSWPTSTICPPKNGISDAPLHAGHRHVLLHHEALAPALLKRLQSVPVEDVCMSVVTKAELLYGVEVSPRRAHDAAALAAFLPYVDAIALGEEIAAHYAEVRADLKRRGAMIGANDLFIAAHARALGVTLVTNNTAEFERIGGLRLENWTLPHRRR
jgi:tRNA(fMet)-specific endonuclease VapC